ncbi:hypothetical protein EMCRGX_G001381 [Ephydatia muelleri]
MEKRIENVNPQVFAKAHERVVLPDEENDSVRDEIDAREIFDLVRNINDPEHPLTLEELNVLQEAHIEVMATLIGLCIRVRLFRSLPERFKVDVRIRPGSHISEQAVNKQLADKERVAAAMENDHLLELVNQCLKI